jgi:hypothetical protein
LISSTYNKLKAIDKITDILQTQGLNAVLPTNATQIPNASFVITPASSLYVNTDDGMDDNIDDNSYELNDVTHPIFNVVVHGFEPDNLYRLHLKHPSEWIDSPPFKTSEDAIQFANYLDGLVNSEDMFDYIKYMYSNDIRDIYHDFISNNNSSQENNAIVETDVNNEVQSVEI